MSYGLLAAFLNSITLFVRILPLYVVLFTVLVPAFQALFPAVAFVCSNTTFFPLVPFVIMSPPLVIHIIVPAPLGAVEPLVNNTSALPKSTVIEFSAPQYVIPADPLCVNFKSLFPFATLILYPSQRIDPSPEEVHSTLSKRVVVLPALIVPLARQYIFPLPVLDHKASRLYVLISPPASQKMRLPGLVEAVVQLALLPVPKLILPPASHEAVALEPAEFSTVQVNILLLPVVMFVYACQRAEPLPCTFTVLFVAALKWILPPPLFT